MRADLDTRGLAVAVLLDARDGAQHLPIKAGDTLGGPLRHRELDMGNAEIDLAEALVVRAVEMDPVAPGAGRLDVVLMILKLEFGVGELLLDPSKPVEQRLAVGRDNADMA